METKLGLGHPHTIACRDGFVKACMTAGRTAELIAYHEATLTPMESRLGPDHPQVIACRCNLAVAYWKARRLDRSIPLFESILKRNLSKLGPDDLKTLEAKANLGVNYRDAGRPAEGARLMADALSRVQGRPDVKTELAWVPKELCLAYDAPGQFALAESLYRDALDQARTSFGPDDPRTAVAMALLGFNLLHQEKWAEAESVLRQCLAVREKMAPDAWSTFNTRSQLGDSLLGQKKYAEAEPLIVSGFEGLKSRETMIPASAEGRLAEAAARIVRLYEDWSKPEKATEWKARLGYSYLDALMPNGLAAFSR